MVQIHYDFVHLYRFMIIIFNLILLQKKLLEVIQLKPTLLYLRNHAKN